MEYSHANDTWFFDVTIRKENVGLIVSGIDALAMIVLIINLRWLSRKEDADVEL